MDADLEHFLARACPFKAEDGTGRILIARVMHGGAADRYVHRTFTVKLYWYRVS